jgi:hypothetical protein
VSLSKTAQTHIATATTAQTGYAYANADVQGKRLVSHETDAERLNY